jgi:hypothetical protein
MNENSYVLLFITDYNNVDVFELIDQIHLEYFIVKKSESDNDPIDLH